MTQEINEEQNIHKDWYLEAKRQTVETLPSFIKHLTEDYRHDYGTICHAVAAAGIAAMTAVNQSPKGHVTGFQAGAIIWKVIRNWGTFGKGPLKMVDFENMLYPQYADKFDKTISKSTWEWLQKEAKEKVKDDCAHRDVIAHWQLIVDGVVPFGYRVEED